MLNISDDIEAPSKTNMLVIYGQKHMKLVDEAVIYSDCSTSLWMCPK